MEGESILSSIRIRVLLLVIIPFLALLGLIVYLAVRDYDYRLTAARNDALQSARHLAASQRRIVTSARQLMSTLAASPAMRQAIPSAACNRALSERLAEYPELYTLHLAQPDGTVICRASGAEDQAALKRTNVSSLQHFRLALHAKGLTLGEYFSSPANGKPAFGLSFPVLDEHRRPRAILSALVGLNWLTQDPIRDLLPPGTHLLVVDDAGKLITHHPSLEHGGDGAVPTDTTPKLKAILAEVGNGGASEAIGLDGTLRIYGSAQLHRSPTGTVHLLVGVPKNVILAPAELELQITLLVGLPLLCLTFLIIWIGGDRMLVTRVIALSQTASELARGNFTARAETPRLNDEISQLSLSFNQMAAALELKEQQVMRANRALRVISAGNRTMLRATDEHMLLEDLCKEIVLAGGYSMAWIGYAIDDDSKPVLPMASYGTPEGFLDDLDITWAESARGMGPSGRAIREGIPVASRNSHTDQDYTPWQALAHRHAYGSLLALPLKIEGRVIGSLNIYAAEPDAFGAEEINLLNDAAADLSYGIAVQRASAGRQQVETELRLLSRAVAQAKVSIVITDRSGTIEYVNPHFEAVTGYTRAEAIGCNPRILKSGEATQDTYVELWRTIASGGEWRGELHNRRKNGELYWEDASISGIVDESGTVSHYVAVKEDVTARKRMESEIHTLNRDLEQRVAERTVELARRNEELHAFSYSISHDLRAPLRGIHGFATALREILLRRADPEELDLVERVRRLTVRMSELIDELLNFSRVGTVEMRRVSVNLDDLVHEIVGNLSIEYPRTRVTSRPLGTTIGDPGLLRQVLENLLGNAFKYSGTRPEPQVEISRSAEEGISTYCVSDNGVGFDMKYAGNLFGVFQRMHSSVQFPGSGVGLAIVKRIVTRHGGRVWAHSAPDAGTRMYFTLDAAGTSVTSGTSETTGTSRGPVTSGA